MTMYDTTTPRSRQTQRISPAEVVSRSFDHRANAVVTHSTRGIPYYTDAIKLSTTNGTNLQFFSLSNHASLSFYCKIDNGTPANVASVKIEAKTQLNDYVSIYEGSNLSFLTEFRVLHTYRDIKVTIDVQGAGNTGTIYIGGE